MTLRPSRRRRSGGTKLANNGAGSAGFPRHCSSQEVVNDVSNGNFAPHAPQDDRLRRSRAQRSNIGAAGRAFAAKDLTVGIVYVGARDDFGWNQAHAVAIKALKEVPGVKVVEEENVPETDAVSKSMESMINLDGAGLILATSFGYYKPFVVDLAKKYPDVEFRHAAPLVEQGQGSEERRLLFRLSQPGALRRRRRRRPLDQVQQARLRRGQADRQRARATSIRSCSARARSTRRRPCR